MSWEAKHEDMDEETDDESMATKYKLPRATAKMAEVSCLRDADHTPLLILAINAKKPNLQLLELLLNCGADANATDKYGRSVLECALQWKDKDFFSDLVKMLFEYGCNPRRKVEAIVQSLQNDAPKTDTETQSPGDLISSLCLSKKTANEALYQDIVNNFLNSNPSKQGKDFEKFLLSINARADSSAGADTDTAPARLGRREHAVGGFGGMTPKFIPATRLMDASGVCILTQAIAAKKYYAAAMLLKYGANPNFRGTDGTLLHQAMQRLPTDAKHKWEGTAVELLLRWGADPSIPDPHGKKVNCPGLEGPFTSKMSASSPANGGGGSAAAAVADDDSYEDDFDLDAEMDVDTGSGQPKGTTSQLRAMITAQAQFGQQLAALVVANNTDQVRNLLVSPFNSALYRQQRLRTIGWVTKTFYTKKEETSAAVGIKISTNTSDGPKAKQVKRKPAVIVQFTGHGNKRQKYEIEEGTTVEALLATIVCGWPDYENGTIKLPDGTPLEPEQVLIEQLTAHNALGHILDVFEGSVPGPNSLGKQISAQTEDSGWGAFDNMEVDSQDDEWGDVDDDDDNDFGDDGEGFNGFDTRGFDGSNEPSEVADEEEPLAVMECSNGRTEVLDENLACLQLERFEREFKADCPFLEDWPLDRVRVLLEAYEFDTDKLNVDLTENDPVDIYTKAGLPHVFDDEDPKDSGDVSVECQICFVDYTVSESYRMPGCGHRYFCLDCFQSYCESELQERKIFVTCPESDCNEPVLSSELQRFLAPESYQKLRKWCGEFYSEKFPQARKCTGAGCPLVLQVMNYERSRPKFYAAFPLHCSCGQWSCLTCNADYVHRPATCETRSYFDKQIKSGDKALQSLLKQCKQCPFCKRAVSILDKTQCDHMTCVCGKQWCWWCLREWQKPGCSCFGGPCEYYKAHKDEFESKEASDATSNDFLVCAEGYIGHKGDLDYACKQLVEKNRTHIDKGMAKWNLNESDMEFMITCLHTVQELRAACQWSYAVSSLYSDELEQLEAKKADHKPKIASPKSKKKSKKSNQIIIIKKKKIKHEDTSPTSAPLAKRPRTMETEGLQRWKHTVQKNKSVFAQQLRSLERFTDTLQEELTADKSISDSELADALAQKLRTPFDKWRFRMKRMAKNSRLFLKIFSEESLRFQRQIAEVQQARKILSKARDAYSAAARKGGEAEKAVRAAQAELRNRYMIIESRNAEQCEICYMNCQDMPTDVSINPNIVNNGIGGDCSCECTCAIQLKLTFVNKVRNETLKYLPFVEEKMVLAPKSIALAIAKGLDHCRIDPSKRITVDCRAVQAIHSDGGRLQIIALACNTDIKKIGGECGNLQPHVEALPGLKGSLGKDYHKSRSWCFVLDSRNPVQAEMTRAHANILAIVHGKCGCGFHKYCMDRWQATGSTDCPSCGERWEQTHIQDLN